MATHQLAAKSTRPAVAGGQMSSSALFPYLDSSDVHGEFSGHPAQAIPGSIYSDSESSDGDAMEPLDQQPEIEQQNLTSESIDTFLDQIATERLSKMPRSGSQWDRALRDAELFANHVSVYQRMLEEYLPSSKIATASLWTNCCLLLELGHGQASSLGQAFQVFHALSLDLLIFERHHAVLSVDMKAREDLGKAYASLHNLVADVASCYSGRMKASATSPIVADFNALFANAVNGFHEFKQSLIQVVWEEKLQRAPLTETTSADYRVIRNWLTPRDEFVKRLSSNQLTCKYQLPESSCDWFQKDFTAFFKSKRNALMITGKPGSGKTVLFHWMVDRLQRRLLGKSYTPISCSIDPAVPIETSSLRLVQSLLLQILDQNIGNTEVLSSLGVAHQKTTASMDIVEHESAMWQAFGKVLGIAAIPTNIVILVDGVEAILGGEPVALTFVDKLVAIVAEVPNATAILLSRPLSTPSDLWAGEFVINTEHTFGDIMQVVVRALEPCGPLQDESDERRQLVAKRIAQSANGSFLWAQFAIELLQKEKSMDGFLRALDKTPKSLGHLMQRLTSALESNQGNIKSVLSWLVVALRPLSLFEVQSLIGVDPRKDAIAGTTAGSAYDIVQLSGSLLVVEAGVVRFRHNALRQFLTDMASQSRILSPPKDAHRDLTSRMLKTLRTDSQLSDAPTMDLTLSPALSEVFRADSLFEYAARYWTVHFYSSSMYKSNGELALSTEFKRSFPTAVTLSVAEGVVSEPSFAGLDPVDNHMLALRIRRAALHDKSPAVLQSLLNTALVLRRRADTAEAGQYFYQASLLSQNILGLSSTITSTCAVQYLASAEQTADKGRSEASNSKEKMLKTLIEASSQEHGSKSEQRIKYQMALSELYIAIGEEALAAAVLDELRDAMVERYGQDSAQANNINKNLAAILQRRSTKGDNSVQFASKLFSLAEQTMDETDPRRIAATFRMAETYEGQGDFPRAEELLVNVWTQTTEAHRRSQTAELQDAKFGAAVTYVEFLRRRTRDPEATSILLGLWGESEQIQAPSEPTVSRFTQFGKMLQSAGQLTVALSALTSTWKVYVSNGMQYSDEAAATASSIAELVQQIQNQPEEPTLSSTPLYAVEASQYSGQQDSLGDQTVLRQVFDNRLRTAPAGQLDEATIQMCNSISAYHVRQCDWAEAIGITRMCLQSIWPSVTSGGTASKLPKRHQAQAWVLADRLTYCLTQDRCFEEALQVHLSMYEASKASENADLMAKASQSLIQFYNETEQIDRAIRFHDELLQRNRKVLGHKHPVTIESLNTLASLCDSAKHLMASHYYEDIVSMLDRESSSIGPSEFKAAVRLSELYSEQGRWPEVVKACEILFKRLDGNHMRDLMTAQTIRALYERYRSAIAQTDPGNTESLQQAAARYFEICNNLLPLQAAMLTQAAFELGEANERSEAHHWDAIPMYENVIQTAPASNEPDVAGFVAKARERLAALYRNVALDPTKSPPSISQSVIAMYVEKYEEGKAHRRCSDDVNLATLAELVALYNRTGTEQNRFAALDVLQGTIAEIVSYETSPMRLWDSARKLAAIYSTNGYSGQGRQVVEVLRRQAIFKYSRDDDGFVLKWDPPSDRRCFVFVATLEGGLPCSGSATFSELIANLLTESSLVERFNQAEAFDQKLIKAAHLRRFLTSNKHHDLAHILEGRVFEAFMATLNTTSTPSEQNMRELLIKTIEELEKDTHQSMGKSACVAGDKLTSSHIDQGEFVDSYEVAFCAYNFAKSLGAYQEAENVVYGLKLALYMAGRGVTGTTTNDVLRGQMRAQSKLILQETIGTCKNLNIDIARMRFSELKDLVDLLNEHQSYAELEWLVGLLWSSHATHKTWSPKDIVWLGKHFVEARFHRGQQDLAIQLCEDIIYNLTILWGPLDLMALEMSVVLSDLYTTTERYQEAMAVHEDILRQLLSRDVATNNHAEAAHIAKKHLRYLKQTSQRDGSSTSDFFKHNSPLLERLTTEFGGDSVGPDMPPPVNWSFGKPTVDAMPSMDEADEEAAEILFTPRKAFRRYH